MLLRCYRGSLLTSLMGKPGGFPSYDWQLGQRPVIR